MRQKSTLKDRWGREIYWDPITNKNIMETWGACVLRKIAGILSIAGILFMIMLIVMGPTVMLNLFAASFMTMDAKIHKDEMRAFVLNKTTYEGADVFEYTKEFLLQIPDIRYVPVSVYNWWEKPVNTIEMGGDCKSSSLLFVSMIGAVGGVGHVDCDAIDNNHCVAKIIDPHNKEYMIVDLTDDEPEYGIYSYLVDHWSNPEDFIERGYVDTLANGKKRIVTITQPMYEYDPVNNEWNEKKYIGEQ